ncbi:MAG: hypothetical protein AAGA59_08255 [Actinomycetota bacterium]
MMATEVTGQLSLLSLIEPPPTTVKRAPSTKQPAKAKQSARVTWIGPATCRACGDRLFIYRMSRRYWTWATNKLVPDCPTCQTAVTTTTFELRQEAS